VWLQASDGPIEKAIKSQENCGMANAMRQNVPMRHYYRMSAVDLR
jgi:hypothetical protein